MYFRLYCPSCGTEDPRPQHGLFPSFAKVVLRKRMLQCDSCGHRWAKDRRSVMSRLFNMSYESHPPVYMDDPPAKSESTEGQGVTLNANGVAHFLSRMAESVEKTADHQSASAEQLSATLTLSTQKEHLFLEQQKAILASQQNLARLVEGMSDVFEKATGKPLPPFSVISNRSREENNEDEDATDGAG